MNTGGPASEKMLLDEFAGQALAGFFGFISETQAAMKDADLPGIKREQVSRECYEQAESMLAEKARREWQMKSAMEKPGVVECVAALCRDHSGDANKMAELQAANRELVEALENVLATQIDPNGSKACKDARAILAKHKETK